MPGGIDPVSPNSLSFLASVIRFGEGFEDDDIFDQEVALTEDLTRLPECYAKFKDVFSENNADILPEHRRFDCEIELKSPDAVPPFRPIYNLGEADRTELKKYIEDMLAKGLIRAYTDHRNLIYFRNRQLLNGRQMRWQMFLGQFHFILLYRKGSENIPADTY